MGSIINNTRDQINKTAFTNSIIYGSKAMSDLSMMFQTPNRIRKPIIESPSVKAPVINPNTRPFDQAMKTMLEEGAGARRIAAQTGDASLNASIFAQTLKGIDQITTSKSGYLSGVEDKNSVFAADAFNKMTAGNAIANNEATKMQMSMQMQEDANVADSVSSANQSFGTSMGQLAMVGSQKDQSIVDLMYLEKYMANASNVLNVNPVDVNTNTTQFGDKAGQMTPNFADAPSPTKTVTVTPEAEVNSIFGGLNLNADGSPEMNLGANSIMPMKESMNPANVVTPNTDPISPMDKKTIGAEDSPDLSFTEKEYSSQSIIDLDSDPVNPDEIAEQADKDSIVSATSEPGKVDIKPDAKVDAEVKKDADGNPEINSSVYNEYKTELGKKYSQGARDGKNSWDCSSLVCHVMGIDSTGVAAADIYTGPTTKDKTEVTAEELNTFADGDLVFFANADGKKRGKSKDIGNIGIVVVDKDNGNRYLFEASGSKGGVVVSDLAERVGEINYTKMYKATPVKKIKTKS